MALKLLALDSDDLSIISAYSQKAELSLANLQWEPQKARLLLAIKRFCWEKNEEDAVEKLPAFSCHSILHFDRVEQLSVIGLDQKNKDEIHKLLAIQFAPQKHKEIYGNIILHFENAAALRLAVECIEARLVDI